MEMKMIIVSDTTGVRSECSGRDSASVSPE